MKFSKHCRDGENMKLTIDIFIGLVIGFIIGLLYSVWILLTSICKKINLRNFYKLIWLIIDKIKER
jgi:Na+/H+-dicarboxylate symporter